MNLRWVNLANGEQALINPDQIVHVQRNGDNATLARFSDGSMLIINLTLAEVKQLLDQE